MVVVHDNQARANFGWFAFHGINRWGAARPRCKPSHDRRAGEGFLGMQKSMNVDEIENAN